MSRLIHAALFVRRQSQGLVMISSSYYSSHCHRSDQYCWTAAAIWIFMMNNSENSYFGCALKITFKMTTSYSTASYNRHVMQELFPITPLMNTGHDFELKSWSWKPSQTHRSSPGRTDDACGHEEEAGEKSFPTSRHIHLQTSTLGTT